VCGRPGCVRWLPGSELNSSSRGEAYRSSSPRHSPASSSPALLIQLYLQAKTQQINVVRTDNLCQLVRSPRTSQLQQPRGGFKNCYLQANVLESDAKMVSGQLLRTHLEREMQDGVEGPQLRAEATQVSAGRKEVSHSGGDAESRQLRGAGGAAKKRYASPIPRRHPGTTASTRGGHPISDPGGRRRLGSQTPLRRHNPNRGDRGRHFGCTGKTRPQGWGRPGNKKSGVCQCK